MIRIGEAEGFSMLEVLVSISIFGIASIGVAHAFVHHMSFNTQSERRGAAVAAAQQAMDGLRVQDPASLPSSGTVTSDITVGQRTFQVQTIYCSNAAYCSSTTRHIEVKVLRNGILQYEVETIFSQLR